VGGGNGVEEEAATVEVKFRTVGQVGMMMCSGAGVKAMACSKAGVKMVTCSKAGVEAAAYSGVGVEDRSAQGW
jgi:hypothetical protein